MATVPVVQVWEGILLVRLIGMLDSARTQQSMERHFGERRTHSRPTLARGSLSLADLRSNRVELVRFMPEER